MAFYFQYRPQNLFHTVQSNVVVAGVVKRLRPCCKVLPLGEAAERRHDRSCVPLQPSAFRPDLHAVVRVGHRNHPEKALALSNRGIGLQSDIRETSAQCIIDSLEASASSAMRLSARRSRRQSSRLIFCITLTYAWISTL